MTIYQTPYNTTVGAGLVTAKITDAVTEAHVRTGFLRNNQNLDTYNTKDESPVRASIITHGTKDEQDLPYFAHPIVVSMKALAHRKEPDYLVADMRPFINVNGDLAIRNGSEYAFAKLRLILSRRWYEGGDLSAFTYLSTVAGGIYSSWISENVSRRLGLDPGDQLKLAIVAAVYYHSLFTNQSFTEADKQKIAISVSRAVRADAQQVFQVLDEIKEMNTLEDFISAVKQQLDGNPRVDPLNVGLLVTLLSTSWWGTNAKEISAVAIDHPPTWLALLYIAFTERTYKASPLARLAERWRGSKGETEFVRSLRYLVDKSTS